MIALYDMDKEEELKELISGCDGNLDAIVVEGADGVGKSKVLRMISNILNVEPYRPDYNFWQKYNLPKYDRWKISGYFLDIFSHFYSNFHTNHPMLFDRGIMSGAAYNDFRLIEDYKRLFRDMKLLHILVVCSKEDFYRYQTIRNPYISKEEIEEEYMKCEEVSGKLLDALDKSGVNYIIYHNEFNELESIKLSSTCEGCGHYTENFCMNPKIYHKVSPDMPRCEHTSDIEVQDIREEIYN